MRRVSVPWLPFLLLASCGAVGAKMPFSQAVVRLADAAQEYAAAGDFLRGLSLLQRTPPHTYTVFGERDRLTMVEQGIGPADSPVPACFRIPSLVRLNDATLLAFAEARSPTCADCSTTGIVLKTSRDAGRTWSHIRYVVPPDGIGANPTTVYDAHKGRVYLYYARGMSRDPVTNSTLCAPGATNWYVTSDDGGATWAAPVDMTEMMGAYAGALPGPGNAVQQPDGRLVIPYHYGTAERSWGRDVMVWSDDGEQYTVATTALPRMDEATVVSVVGPALAISPDADTSSPPPLVVWMRNAHNNATCDCKARSVSTDNGFTWSSPTDEPYLLDPICQGSAVAFDATVMYVGPRFRYARSRLTLWHAPAATVDNATQHDVPTPWSRVDVTDASVYTDYSALTNGLMRDPAMPDRSHVGVLWGGCVLPFPFRVWCARYWQVAYTRVAWPPMDTPCRHTASGEQNEGNRSTATVIATTA